MSQEKQKQIVKTNEDQPTHSDDQTVLVDAEPIWNYSALDMHKFYAAALFLDNQKDPARHMNWSVDVGDDRGSGWQIKDTNDLLDQLAILFARFRTPRTPLNGAECDEDALSACANVTATALQIPSYNDNNVERRNCTVWVAKNGGPHTFDGLTDASFAQHLESWYNGLTDPRFHKEDHIWTLMRDFWVRRTKTYLDRLCKIRNVWSGSFGNSEVLLQRLWEITPCEPQKRTYPRGDVEYAWNLLTAMHCTNVSEWNEDAVNEYYDVIWFDNPSKWSSEYPSIKMNELLFYRTAQELKRAADKFPINSVIRARICKEAERFACMAKSDRDLAQQFREVMIALTALRIPKSTMENFVLFRRRHQNVNLRISFVDPQVEVKSVSVKPIIDTIESLVQVAHNSLSMDGEPTPLSGVEEQTQAFNYRAIQAAMLKFEESISNKKEIRRHFHCVLQLLGKFLGTDDVHNYFGSTYFSCYLCWGLLCSSRYRTRGTNAKIHVDSAFPFEFSEENEAKLVQLADVLKKMQMDLLSHMMTQASNSDEGEFKGVKRIRPSDE